MFARFEELGNWCFLTTNVTFRINSNAWQQKSNNPQQGNETEKNSTSQQSINIAKLKIQTTERKGGRKVKFNQSSTWHRKLGPETTTITAATNKNNYYYYFTPCAEKRFRTIRSERRKNKNAWEEISHKRKIGIDRDRENKRHFTSFRMFGVVWLIVILSYFICSLE